MFVRIFAGLYACLLALTAVPCNRRRAGGSNGCSTSIVLLEQIVDEWIVDRAR